MLIETGLLTIILLLLDCHLLDCFKNTDFAGNIQTYDFTTLYTNLDNQNIKTALTSVIKLAFKHAKCLYMFIYHKSSAWVNKPREGAFYFDHESLIDAVNFLIDSCYFTLGDNIFREIIGVPIGVDPGPHQKIIQKVDSSMCGDGQYDSPGFSAKFSTYSIMNCDTNDVIDFCVIQKGQFTTDLERFICRQYKFILVHEYNY